MNWKFALLSFEGRLNRSRYWIASIVVSVAVWVISFLDMSVIHGPTMWSITDENGNSFGFGIITLVATIATMIVGVALAVKRLHDRDRSGWFYLLLLVPLVNIWIVIEILFLRGTAGPNRFGPDPLSPAGGYPITA